MTSRQLINKALIIFILTAPTMVIGGEGQWYIGASGGMSILEPTIGDGSSVVLDQDSDTAGKIFAGYDVTENWSIEAFYAYLGEATFLPANTLEYQTYGLAGMYSWPDNQDGFSVFLKGGVDGIYNVSTLPVQRADDVQFYGGAGIEYHINNRFSVRLEADYYEEDAQYVGLGLKVRFGGSAPRRKVDKPDPVDDDFGPDFEAVETIHTPEVVDPIPQPVEERYDAVEQYESPVSVIEPGISRVLDGVTFEFGSPRLTPESRIILNGVVQSLQQQPDIRVKVDGHTDSVGNPAANRRLSLLRARSVALYLVEQGIARNRVKYLGFGGDRPRADNSTAEGRRLNRRVEILAY